MTRLGVTVVATAIALAFSTAVAQGMSNAASEKRDADYAVAKERSDAYAGGAKDYCPEQAKARFGRS